MSTAEFFGALVAVIIGSTGSTIALAVYLSGRIDRLGDRLDIRIDRLTDGLAQLHEDFVLHKADREAHR